MLISCDVVFYPIRAQNCPGEKSGLRISQMKVNTPPSRQTGLPPREDLAHENKFASQLVIAPDQSCIW